MVMLLAANRLSCFFNSSKQGPSPIAKSGGIDVKLGKPIDPLVVEVMNEIGYDMSSARRKFVDEVMTSAADKIISFKPADELPDFIREHDDITYWPIPDPQHQAIEFHRKVRDEVRLRVNNLIKELEI